jgi:hypothetical protein
MESLEGLPRTQGRDSASYSYSYADRTGAKKDMMGCGRSQRSDREPCLPRTRGSLREISDDGSWKEFRRWAQRRWTVGTGEGGGLEGSAGMVRGGSVGVDANMDSGARAGIPSLELLRAGRENFLPKHKVCGGFGT